MVDTAYSVGRGTVTVSLRQAVPTETAIVVYSGFLTYEEAVDRKLPITVDVPVEAPLGEVDEKINIARAKDGMSVGLHRQTDSWGELDLEKEVYVGRYTIPTSNYEVAMTTFLSNDPIPWVIPAVVAGSVVFICTYDRITAHFFDNCSRIDSEISFENGFTCKTVCERE